ncbi:MAG: hydantoinase B/oxoprolinase family protein [Gammaproteobacteria bacterium]|nr:hydantoinase B/oxoprolinase family protein [Gammaproteobacteria bacterium]
MDAIELSLFHSRVQAVCEEMGAVLRRTALSTNIRDRRDYSCAVFDHAGRLGAQAAHIPVHLGSMAYAMTAIVREQDWQPGSTLILNDPFMGGTHLPDVTLVSPVFLHGRLKAFVANRAHHADIGATAPGSMPVSTTLDEEGLVIPPTFIARHGRLLDQRLANLCAATANAADCHGDMIAQLSANLSGVQRLQGLMETMGEGAFDSALGALNAYAETLARQTVEQIPDGRYTFTDILDDDGAGTLDLPIRVQLVIAGDAATVDFAGTHDQVTGNVNCPLSVTAAAVFYVFRCLMPAPTPACDGALRPLAIAAPAGSLVNARRPAAVAAGNVETSTRIVDAVLGALAAALPDRIPAASHGSMNNLAMGARKTKTPWDYYETIGGGMGAGRDGGGLDGVQTHMTNTLNTPAETLEMRYPLRVTRYALRRGSGGAGRRRGGDGLVREMTSLQEATVTLLTERRRHPPWGLAGGGDGSPGRNLLNDRTLPSKTTFTAHPGDRLAIETPGGGGWGAAEE